MSKADLFEAIQSFDQQDAKQLYDKLIGQADCLLDSEGGTILHVAANYNNQEIIRYALEHFDDARLRKPDQYSVERKRAWLNAKDNDGFTCLHYAVFRGNSALALLLEEHGSDVYIINKQGLNALHIAAQGDSPFLMLYFLNKGIKISTVDANGRTALHWACYSGQENAAFALLAWGAEMDKQEFTFGMTPLHLAVMSGNGRIVKKLLVRGCDRDVANFNGKVPLQLAQQYQYKSITEMIIDKRGIEELFNIKTPFRRLPKVTFPFYFLLVLYLINYILNISFVLFKNFPQQSELAFVYLILGFLVGVFFVIVSCKKPGFIEISQKQNDYQMLRKYSPSKICYECMLVKPDRSRHCQICGRCVSVYDHHCPWVSNCIGSKNYFWFFTFLVLMESFMIFTIVFQVINITQVHDWIKLQALDIVRIICVVFGLLCSLVFLIPLSYLLYVQTRNCLANQTTFERFSYQNAVPASRRSSSSITETIQDNLLHNKSMTMSLQDSLHPRSAITEEHSSTCNNCYLMCFGNAKNISYHIGKFR